MYPAMRALGQSGTESPKLPLLDGLKPLYELEGGVYPRRGNLIMIAGRSGSGKSSFALWLAQQWNMHTMYWSADMTASQATLKLLSNKTQRSADEVESELEGPNREALLRNLEDSRISFSFRNPIRFEEVVEELNAYVTLYNRYPEMAVFDNLANIDGAESSYEEQMFAMSVLTELIRKTGMTGIILHHASDKSWDARDKPFYPPSRQEIKGGHSEFPEMILGVALNNLTQDFHIAPLKNRGGFQQPTGTTFAKLRVNSQTNTFHSTEVEHYLSNGV